MYGYGPRRGFGLLGLLFGLILLGIVAAVAYSVGASASGSAAAPAVAPFFWFGGFHILGFLFFLLIIGLILAAIFRPRGWGHHGWYGGYGPGPWGGYRGQEMRDVPPPFEPMLESWHRRAHGETAPTSNASPTQPSTQPKS